MSRLKITLHLLAAMLALWASPPVASGQAAAPTTNAPAADPLVVPTLNGVVVWPAADDVKREGVLGIGGVRVMGPDFLRTAKFEHALAPFLGRPLTVSGLGRLQQEIVLFCRRADRPVVDVIVPEQEVKEGVLQIIVIEGRLGQVTVRNLDRKWFNDRLVLQGFRLKPDEPISGRELTESLDWLNRNSLFRGVGATFKPGAVGRTDVVLNVEDRLPLRAFANYEDSGVTSVGEHRLSTGFTWANVWGLDHQLGYAYLTDSQFTKLTAHSVSYTAPLPWRHTLTLSGSVSSVRPDLGAGFSGFSQQGESSSINARYDIPLPRWLNWYKHELSLAFDYKTSNSNVEFGGSSIFNSPTDVVQGMLGYRGTVEDLLGIGTFATQWFHSPGGLTTHNADSFYNSTRADAKAAYDVLRISGERVTKLPLTAEWRRLPASDCYTWALRGTWQWTNERLLPSEQIGAGGYATVRGYDERAANGDTGWLISNELRTPAFRLGSIAGGPDTAAYLQALAFHDLGFTEIVRPRTGEAPSASLSSIGAGLRFGIGRHVSLRLDYGFQLGDRIGTTGRDRGHIGLQVSF